jgi:hypothetical protein
VANDDYTLVNRSGVPLGGVSQGDALDESGLTYGSAPTTRKRSRVVIGGDAVAAALIDPIDTDPVGTEYALPVRVITQTPNNALYISLLNKIASLISRSNYHLGILSDEDEGDDDGAGCGGGFSSVLGAPVVSSTSAQRGWIVSTVAVLVLPANSLRKSVLITNNLTSNIYVGPTSSVATTGVSMGSKIVPNGEYADSGDGLWMGDIYAIGDAVSLVYNLSVWEKT